MSLRKRIALAVAGLLVLLVIAVFFAATYFARELEGKLDPPANPPGQPSIASYERPDPDPPVGGPPLVTGFDWNTIGEPPRSARPWTRWWWPGGAVDESTLVQQLEDLDAAGFGGGEIQPFLSGVMAVEDPEVWDQVYDFDSPAYYEKLGGLMRAAEARSWQLDLTHFSGWPPGGPEVNLEDSPIVVVKSEATVTGGKKVELELPLPSAGPSESFLTAIELAGADFINFPATHAELLSVLAARRTGGERASSSFVLDDTVELDSSSIQLLTEQVDGGVLRWDAPAGEWYIVVSWLMPSGEVPIGAAQKPQGFAVDHLRRAQLRGHLEYAFGERTGLIGHYGRGFRGIFTDSLEFRLTRMSAADILAEFEARRGYGLEPYLPAVFVEGTDNMYFRELMGVHPAPEFALTPSDDRIRHDYQLTISDLMIERFVETSTEWAEARGLVSRGQSYGMDMDLIRALGATQIPETEQLWAGGSNLGLKMASSAAALYGRPLVSSESFVWIARDWSNTARKLKATADKAFLGGINHIVYHGTPYPWSGDEPSPFGEEGWTPFSSPGNPGQFSSIVAPNNTALWPDIPDLNGYIARSQNLLRQGKPAIDVLVYYPFLGFHGVASGGDGAEPLVRGFLPDSDPLEKILEDPLLTSGKKLIDVVLSVPPGKANLREIWVEQVAPLLSEFDRRGISWGWVNDHALQTGRLGARTLAEGGSYGALLVPNVPMVEAETLRALIGLSSQQVPVVLAGSVPAQQPGFRDAEQGDRDVAALVEQLVAAGGERVDFDAQSVAVALQSRIETPVRATTPSSIQSLRRQLSASEDLYFFANQRAEADTLELEVPGAESFWWFDARSGSAWPAAVRDGRLSLTLRGFESRFLVRGVAFPAELEPSLPASALLADAIRSFPLSEWEFSVDESSPRAMALGDWREIPELQHERGPGVYRHRLVLDPLNSAARYALDLGLLHGSGRVTVNGTEIGRASLPPFVVDLGDTLRPGENTIEVEVLAPLRNYFVGRGLAGDEKYSHMANYGNQLQAAGLIGPAAVLELPGN